MQFQDGQFHDRQSHDRGQNHEDSTGLVELGDAVFPSVVDDNRGSIVVQPYVTSTRESSSLSFADLVGSVAFAALLALSVGLCSAEVLVWGCDASGVLFLILAFAYRGSRKVWWLFWAPASLVLLFAPIAIWEQAGVLPTLGLVMRLSFAPGLAFIAGALIAGVRDTVQISIESADEARRLRARAIANKFELRRLGLQMKVIIDSIAAANFGQPIDDLPDGLGLPGTTPEFASRLLARGNLGFDPLSESNGDRKQTTTAMKMARGDANFVSSYGMESSDAMSHVQIHALIAEEVRRLSQRLLPLKLKVNIRFNSTTESPVPLAVRGRPEILRTIVRDLLGVATDSLLKGDGMLMIALRPGLRQLTLSIEDNGRGLNEAMLIGLEDKGLATRTPRLSVREIRSLTLAVGWSLGIQGRLGVGSRITLDLPRVDRLAANHAPSRNDARIGSGIEIDGGSTGDALQI